MADGLGEFQSLPSLGPLSVGGAEGHLSFGEDDPDFVNEADRLRFQCPVHKGLLHDTVQTPCGHRVCRACVGVWLNGAKSKRCPVGEADCEDVTETNVLAHRDDCPMLSTDCSLKKMGCTFMGRKEEVEKHEKEALVQHLELMAAFAAELQKTTTEAHEKIRNLSADREDFGNRLQLTEAEDERTAGKIQDLDQQVSNLKMRLVTALERAITVDCKTSELVARFAAVEQNVRGMQQRITQLEQRRDRDQPQQQGSVVVKCVRNMHVACFGNVDNMPESISNQLSGHEQQLQLHGVRMAEMDLRFQLLETASYNGTLLWKIRDYAQRKRDAVNARTLSLDSQPFYSHRFGYKMCARVYLNGDGVGKTTHLSLFFVVMRGEYDDLLPWPFRQEVTLTLLDQSAEKRHLTKHFYPDPNSSSFRKPVSEMNVASECPMFVSHGVLESKNSGYLKDDTIFIRILVDICN